MNVKISNGRICYVEHTVCYKALNFVNVYRDNSKTKIAQGGVTI